VIEQTDQFQQFGEIWHENTTSKNKKSDLNKKKSDFLYYF